VETPFPAYRGDEPYVFVCYAHGDSAEVYLEIEWLHDQGIDLWYDEGISAGKVWRAEIAKAIQGASKFLYYISAASLASEHCNREVDYALNKGFEIVPVYLEEVDLTPELDLALNRVQALHRDQDASYQQHLLNALGHPGQPARAKTNDQIGLATMHSIAILPFINMSIDDETGFLAEGLSEDILDNLAQYENIMVASRSASFQFSDRGYNPSVVGEKLKVAYLLEGSVRQRGDDVRITAQLIRTEDGFQVWSKSYERKLADGFEMQTTLAASIAYVAHGKLDIDLFKNDKRLVGIDPIAAEHYINAMDEYFNIRLGEGGDFETLVRFLKSAVEVDANFYTPYFFLTTAYYQRHRYGMLSLREARPAAHEAINSAIALAPHNFQTQFQLATVHLHLDLDYARAQAELRQLLKRRPKFGLIHLRLARIELREGRTSEILSQLANASQLEADNEQALYLSNLAWILCVAKDYEGALEATTVALKLVLGSPDRVEIMRTHATSLIHLGRTDEARLFVDEGWRLGRSTSPENYIALFANIGDMEKSKKISIDSHFDLVNHYALAMGYLALKDFDNTFKSIHAGIENHDQHLLESMLVAEWWNPIRDDPRFEEMLELLDSKVTHTEQYLRDNEIEQGDQ